MRAPHRLAVLALPLGLLSLAAARAQSPPPAPGPGLLSEVEVSLDVLTAAGGSTATDAELLDLKGGAHDPRKRGFTLQQAELTVAGVLGEDLAGTASLIASIDPENGETVIELEEAVLAYRGFGHGLAVEAGVFFTDVGRINARHPHERDWLDQPVIHTRLLGGDGMRGPGLRLRWRPDGATGWSLSLGAQNANGETMASFLADDELYAERGIGGRFFAAPDVHAASDLVWAARAGYGVELGGGASGAVGLSAALGPNATGDGGETLLYGLDLALGLRHEDDVHEHTWLVLEGELLGRAFDAAAQVDASGASPVVLPGETLDDWGGYLQALVAVGGGWSVGLRGGWATGSGDSYDQAGQTFGRAFDPYRDDRLRVSPLLTWAPSESARFRLQYDYDDADWTGGADHSVWLGFELQLGAHATH